MSIVLIIPLSVFLLITIFLSWYISVQNKLIRSKNEVTNAFSSVDIQLKKRIDLIPNIVSTIKQYTSYESALLEKVTALRTKSLTGNLNENEKMGLDAEISKSLSQMLISVENYPDLKASEQFTMLTRTLNEVESQISAARRYYSTSVTRYNNNIETFPSSIIANNMNYKEKAVFEIKASERENVEIKNLFERDSI